MNKNKVKKVGHSTSVTGYWRSYKSDDSLVRKSGGVKLSNKLFQAISLRGREMFIGEVKQVYLSQVIMTGKVAGRKVFLNRGIGSQIWEEAI